MTHRNIINLILLFFLSTRIAAQNVTDCVALGQLPETALPICGSTGLIQSSVPIFVSANLVVPGCNTEDYTDKNPFWYKFTCYTSGPLSFTITPNNISDDYDWQLYDVTGHNIRDVFTNPSLVVTGNWSGSSGPTGASASGVNYIQCASIPSDNAPTFSQMPMLIQGHNYLLLVSHFSDSQSGYSLTFGTGKENITDNTIPEIISVTADKCNGKIIGIKLNKNVMCKSISKTGTFEFDITDLTGTIINSPVITSVYGNGCESGNCYTGFDTDSITIVLDNYLPPGIYRLKIKNGQDGNTLLDNCGNAITAGTLTISFSSVPKMSAAFNYSIKYGCEQDTVSYFINDTTAIKQYFWTFDDNTIQNSTLANPIVYYTLFGNKITTLEVRNQYNCKVVFKDTVYLYNILKAVFEATMFVCPNDSAIFKDKSLGDSIIKWNWSFGNGNNISESNSQTHVQFYEDDPFNNYQVPISLSVENNLGCTDHFSSYITIVKNCYIAVPSAFTPNGDGLNDYLYPLNAYKSKDLKFSVYSRFGNRVFYTEDWTKKWDGKIKGREADQGAYVWVLQYFDSDKNKKIELKGSVVLFR